MRDHSNCTMGYYVSHEAYYVNSRVNQTEKEIMIGLYSEEGGTSGEFALRWIDLGKTAAARLEIFEDSWSALQEIQNRTKDSFFASFANIDSTNPSPKDIVDILNQLGFKDRTTRESPHRTTEAGQEARKAAISKLTNEEIALLGITL